MFRSSLPVGRVLEDPDDLPPVIVCYKLNGELLNAERGGPVRIVVPEHYGFKSVKWLTHIVLSNLFHANDTYGTQNNDVDSPLKTFAATLSVPTEVKAEHADPGYRLRAGRYLRACRKCRCGFRRMGRAGPRTIRTSRPRRGSTRRSSRRPRSGAASSPGDAIPKDTLGFDATGKPKTWPMRLAKAHWAALLPGLPAGEYTLRCRTIDAEGAAQPMPRPFKKSGRCEIESLKITVSA